MVMPDEVALALGVGAKHVGRMVLRQQLPPYDMHLNARHKGWHRSTLRAHGLLIPLVPVAPPRQGAGEAARLASASSQSA